MVAILRVAAAEAATVTVPGTYASIQEAAANAPDGSVIQIAPGRYHEQIRLQNVTRSLTFLGDPANPSNVVIDGDGMAAGVIRINTGRMPVEFQGITVTGGRGTSGFAGGIWAVHATVVFRDCVITANTSDTNGGGAMLLDVDGVFQRCEFRGNSAAIYGGGVMLDSGSTVAFERCQILDNQSGTGDPQGPGGGLTSVNSSPTLVGCLVKGNHSTYAAGGILALGTFDRASSTITLQDTTIQGNSTARADAMHPAAEGGGMHVEDNVVGVLDRCRVLGNTSNRGGGLNNYRARYEITDSIIEDNVVDSAGTMAGNGGGIFAASTNDSPPVHGPASIQLTRTVVRNNTAETGGGIFVFGDFVMTNMPSLVDIVDSMIVGNTSTSSGGGFYGYLTATNITGSMILGNHSGDSGGGVMSAGSTVLTIDDTTIAGNDAPQTGGGVYANQGGELHVTNSRILGNVASASDGGGAFIIGSTVGPLSSLVTGNVAQSVIAGNGPNIEIVESDCAGSGVTYTSNVIHTSAPSVYWRPCLGPIATVSAFNGLAGKASNNVDQSPTLATLLGAPGTIAAGATSVLAWSIAGKSAPAIDGGVGALATSSGTRDVMPTQTTTYTLSGSGASQATASVVVDCAALDPALPRSPRNGQAGQDVDATTLSWYPAAGAASYDVYVDTTAHPATRVVQDTTATSVTVNGLTPSTTYHWRVVAKSPACAVPASSPVFAFRTCATAACAFADDFDGQSATTWTSAGRGFARVVDGRLVIAGKGRFSVAPPFPAIGDGSLSLSLMLTSGHREARVVFGAQNATTYREIVLSASGRVRLIQHGGTRRTKQRTLKQARRGRISRTTPVLIELDLSGASVLFSVDGVTVVSATLASPNQGTFGVGVSRGTASIDDVHIVAE